MASSIAVSLCVTVTFVLLMGTFALPTAIRRASAPQFLLRVSQVGHGKDVSDVDCSISEGEVLPVPGDSVTITCKLGHQTRFHRIAFNGLLKAFRFSQDMVGNHTEQTSVLNIRMTWRQRKSSVFLSNPRNFSLVFDTANSRRHKIHFKLEKINAPDLRLRVPGRPTYNAASVQAVEVESTSSLGHFYCWQRSRQPEYNTVWILTSKDGRHARVPCLHSHFCDLPGGKISEDLDQLECRVELSGPEARPLTSIKIIRKSTIAN